MLLAGMLDRVITVQRQTIFSDPQYGSELQEWTNLFTNLRARFIPKAASESLQSDTLAESVRVDASFVIRYPRLRLTTKDRILFDGSVWDIGGVREVQRGTVVEITVKRSPERYPTNVSA